MVTTLTLRVEDFRYNGNGTITLHFPSRPIPREVQQMVEEYLPNTADQFFRLLDKETLLMSVADESEVSAPVTRQCVNMNGVDYDAERLPPVTPVKKSKI